MRKLYLLIVLSFLLNCKNDSFKVPIGYNITGNQLNKMDSIDKNYDSLIFLNKDFKTLENFYLSKENANPKKKLVIYDNSEIFSVSQEIDKNNKVIEVIFQCNKKYLLDIFSDDYSKKSIYDDGTIKSEYEKLLNTTEYRNNRKDKLSLTFNVLFKAFTEKYGEYNYCVNDSLFGRTYNWLKDGVKISLNYNATNSQEHFDPLNKGIYILSDFSNYWIKYNYQSINIIFKDIRGVKLKGEFLKTEANKHKKEILKNNEQKKDIIKKINDSVERIKTKSVLRKL